MISLHQVGLDEAIRDFQPYYLQIIEELQPARIAASADEPSLAFGEDVAAEGEAMADEENKPLPARGGSS